MSLASRSPSEVGPVKIEFTRGATAAVGRRILLCIQHQEEQFVKVRIRQVRGATCLLLTSLFVSIGCNNDPQYGVITRPKDTPVPN